jgi:hypothetical protein
MFVRRAIKMYLLAIHESKKFMLTGGKTFEFIIWLTFFHNVLFWHISFSKKKKNVTIISVPYFTFWMKRFDKTWDISTLHLLIPYNQQQCSGGLVSWKQH